MKIKTVRTDEIEPGMIISLGGPGTGDDVFVYNIVLSVTEDTITVYRIDSLPSFYSEHINGKLQCETMCKYNYRLEVWNLLNLTKNGFSVATID
jgi:hypothetical protein